MKIYFIIFILALTTISAFSQKIIPHDNTQLDTIRGKYSFEGIPYKYKNMDAVFSNHSIAHPTYINSKKLLQTGGFLGTLSNFIVLRYFIRL